jgi:hypothetical protein
MDQNEIPVAHPVPPPKDTREVPQSSSRATATLICGILSITCSGLVTGIPAIILGAMELKAIKAGKSPEIGGSITKLGLILGAVGTLLSILAILAFIAIIALGISLGTSGAIHEMMNQSI